MSIFSNSGEKLTPISELGEFGLIQRLVGGFSSNEAVIKGPGDDAAVYDLNNGDVLISTVDLLAEGVHFDLAYVPLMHLGYKSVVVNLSDIFAMNAKPFGILVSVAMSNRFTVEAMDELYLGIKKACERYGVSLLGGDTSASQAGLIISITALGLGKKEDIVYRKGAEEKDLICVSGNLGAAYAGLQMLEREKEVFATNPEIQPELSEYTYCIGRQLKPENRIDIIDYFTSNNIKPTAMIDISDGLGNELHHICKSSEMGCVIYQEKIPIDFETQKIAESFNISPVTYAMNGGEDYELLFTLPLRLFDSIKEQKLFTIIGHIVPADQGLNIVTTGGSLVEIPFGGFNHF